MTFEQLEEERQENELRLKELEEAYFKKREHATAGFKMRENMGKVNDTAPGALSERSRSAGRKAPAGIQKKFSPSKPPLAQAGGSALKITNLAPSSLASNAVPEIKFDGRRADRGSKSRSKSKKRQQSGSQPRASVSPRR
jgi:hypothetical protein